MVIDTLFPLPGFQFGLPEVQWTETPLFLTWLMSSVGDVFRYDIQDTYQPDLMVRRDQGILLLGCKLSQ